MHLRVSSLSILLVSCASAMAGDTVFNVGGDLAVYDDPHVQQGSIPLDLSYRRGDWTFEATDSYYYREGTPAITFRGKHGSQLILVPIRIGNRTIWVPRPRKPIAGEPTVWGWGDLSVNTTYTARLPDEHHLGVDLTVTATLPTGSKSRNFSTGTYEYAVGTVLTKMSGSMTYILNAQYNLNGDVSGSESQDGWTTQLSGFYTSARGHTIGLQYNWAEAAIPDASSSRVLEIIATLSMSKRNKVAFTVGHGLGLSDPVTEVNATLSRSF